MTVRQESQPRLERELVFRLFVSSTFGDMIAERNALQTHVFPRIRDYCRKHGARFQAIDLRWGISDDAALDQTTMRICRAEIARAQAITPKPNFLVLLGNRYGWRPLPDEIPASEFDALRPFLPPHLTDRWYKLDENASRPIASGVFDRGVFVLQPRTGEFSDHARWRSQVERPLGEALRLAAARVGLPAPDRMKYEWSATAQEIHYGALAVADARDHVLAVFRELHTQDGSPIASSPAPAGKLSRFVDTTPEGEIDAYAQDQLATLKGALRPHLDPQHIHSCTTAWDGHDIGSAHLPGLCVQVYRRLRRLLRRQIQQYRSHSAIADELAANYQCAARHTQDFIGQSGALSAARQYLATAAERPLLVCGPPGSGKSALIARLSDEHRRDSPAAQVVIRFIGATANSTDLRLLLHAICVELAELYGVADGQLPPDLHNLIAVFRMRLTLATKQKPLTLFLDAADQVGEHSPRTWLPGKLPPNVHLVLSAGSPDAFRSLQRSPAILELRAMDPTDAITLLDRWLQRAGRRVVNAQQLKVCHHLVADGATPLFLRLSFEQIRRWRSYAPAELPGRTVDELVSNLLDRLTSHEHHDVLLVERALSYITTSRHGVTEDELLDLLAADEQYWQHLSQSAFHALPASSRAVPAVIWLRLYHDLEPYLSWRLLDSVSLMSFSHRCFDEIARVRWLSPEPVRSARRAHLVNYFRHAAANPSRQDARPLLEFAWQLSEAREHERLKSLLTDLASLQRMLAYREVDAMAYWRSLSTRYNMPAEILQSMRTADQQVSPEAASDLRYAACAFLQVIGAREAAIDGLKFALASDEAAFGENTPRVGRDLTSLALELDRTGSRESRPLFERALQIVRADPEASAADLATAMNNLALNCTLVGDMLSARKYWQDASRVLADAQVPQGPTHALIWFNEALYHPPQSAVPKLRQALVIIERTYGPNHPQTARYILELAKALVEFRPVEAEKLARRALMIYETAFGETDGNAADAQAALARILAHASRFAEAEQLLRRALDVQPQSPLRDPAFAAHLYDALAHVLLLSGRPSEARPWLLKALAVWEGRPECSGLARSARQRLSRCR